MRIVSRVIVLNHDKDSILLARNRDSDFWYPPGGGWEFQTDESLRDAGHREVMEECGVEISIERMMYLQEFHETDDKIALEVFWLGTALSEHNKDHVDLDPNGQVEEVKWIPMSELPELKVFPKILQESFVDDLQKVSAISDQYIFDSLV